MDQFESMARELREKLGDDKFLELEAMLDGDEEALFDAVVKVAEEAYEAFEAEVGDLDSAEEVLLAFADPGGVGE